MTLHLLEESGADRLRIVVETRAAEGRRFEMTVPKDASVVELERFLTEVVAILRQRRIRELETTQREKPP